MYDGWKKKGIGIRDCIHLQSFFFSNIFNQPSYGKRKEAKPRTKKKEQKDMIRVGFEPTPLARPGNYC